MRYFFAFSERLYEICQFSAIAHYLCNTNRINGISGREFIFNYGLGDYKGKYESRERMHGNARKDSHNDHGYAYFKAEYRRFNSHYQSIKGKRKELFYIDELDPKHNITKKNRNENMQYEYSTSIRKPIFSEAYIVHCLNCIGYNMDDEKDNTLIPENFVLSERMKKAANAYDTFFGLYNNYFKKIKDGNNPRDSIVNKHSKKLKLDEFKELHGFIFDTVNDSKFNEYLGIGLFRAEKQYHFTAHIDLASQICAIRDRGDKFKKAFLLTPLKYIPFRQIRQEIINIEGFIERKCACLAFETFIAEVECMGAALIDEFIERGVISSDYEKALSGVANKLYSNVLYEKTDVDMTKTPTQNDFKIIMTTHDEYYSFAQGYPVADEECYMYLKESIESELMCEVPEKELMDTFHLTMGLYRKKIRILMAFKEQKNIEFQPHQ
jgi:hypothetical protein